MTPNFVTQPRYWLQLALLTGIYVLAGLLSFAVMVNDGLASLVWAPTGISIAALMVAGYRYWPAVFFGATLTNFLMADNLLLGSIIGVGNTLEAVLAVSLIRRFTPMEKLFDGIRTTVIFIVSASLIAPIPSALAGAFGMLAFNIIDADHLQTIVGVWWLGDAMGALTLTPAIYLIGQRIHKKENAYIDHFNAASPERVIIVCASIILSTIIYALPGDTTVNLSYLPFLMVLWGALRLPQVYALLLSMMVSIIAIGGALAQVPTQSPPAAIDSLVYLYLFLATQTGTVLLVGALARDREKITEQLVDAQQTAEAASAQKSLFLTNISHEIRTPLNGIIGVTGIMLPDVQTNRQREHLRIIQNSADSLLNLLNDLLDHARIEAGKLRIQRQTFYLPRLLNDVTGLFESQAEAKGLYLRANISGDLPKYVVNDDSRIRQILINIIGNSLKFTNSGGISVSISRAAQSNQPGQVIISVEDTGIGIAADAQNRIFDAFTQADNSTSRLYGGSGLGLTISKQLAEQLGGSIALTSSPGIGTRIDLTLPLTPATLNQEFSFRRQVELNEDDTGKIESLLVGKRILVAEDNQINAEVTERMLKRLGHNVTVVENGEAALAVWQQGFDLILMDCRMPILDGYSTSRAIRKLERNGASHIPIIALTANAMNDEREKCTAAGMDDYLSKPTRLQQLDSMLRRHLRPRA
ncbi:MAG: MASE1 domain-containing protein [Gammaproteobacteria bacterium]|jgi:signal transduction histidine kinase/ActR/RegA family two-component response regulator|nr:MASE1 domain-containing protein [Gammaproteobacteria bacterium]MBQ0774646.1 MASE1 domain-containing protein [Gammaproteobacteria bacterium]